jgi:hypothetical protein
VLLQDETSPKNLYGLFDSIFSPIFRAGREEGERVCYSMDFSSKG